MYYFPKITMSCVRIHAPWTCFLAQFLLNTKFLLCSKVLKIKKLLRAPTWINISTSKIPQWRETSPEKLIRMYWYKRKYQIDSPANERNPTPCESQKTQYQMGQSDQTWKLWLVNITIKAISRKIKLWTNLHAPLYWDNLHHLFPQDKEVFNKK